MATSPSRLERRAKPGSAIDAEIVAVTALLSAVLVVGLATAADYGLTVDEFNTDDYGPKVLAWYTSGFVDRSHFETVEFPLWYYGPWFQMLTAYIQSFDLADRVTVRHAMTFLVGLAALAALLPIGRLAGGRWAGLAAIALCLMTGYFYGSLFFTPIDVPFVAAMTWATLAILVMTRQGPAVLAGEHRRGSADRARRRHANRRHHHPRLPARRAPSVRRGILRDARPIDAALPRCHRCALWGRCRHRLDHRLRALAVAADRQSLRAIQDRACPFRDHPDVV